ncbi:single-stranded DNA-binding protein [Nocardioides sp. BP30]|uniref:single-stranded DNA-binding protein n=1 Tax=Nocardioides sp. BP30 TaxID=3036374 RepID=UPI002469020D|nr:single-stranded DNA-binding protein [Nocardioides sp. BP30]WGL51571.1 single-stranded DNA-binding protein [Nocardioides sp. BP30]
MNESYITVHGYVVAAPVVRNVGDHSVANFRIGVTPRKLERSSGEWRDDETQWYSVSAWRALGDNVARSLRKGDPVIVQGRLNARTWVNASHAEVVAHEIEATVVGHDLRRGFSTFAKTASGVAAEGAPRTGAGSTPAGEAGVTPGDQPGAEPGQVPVESARPADWSAPLADAPGWAGAA